ncbi:MAG: sulfatase-like hydrolase/transferase [Mediterranea sp.]|jgi:arylsulfatase A-like enzyme|nr:sulfatase-like hydrolase/transferase [Mediterranea sp.]
MKQTCFWSLAGLVSVCSAQAVEKPHIVIIYTDDMGIGDLSCYNNGWTATPNIDRLAANGLTFNHYYTASPVSSPSRVSLTTGMFPTEWGVNTFLHDRAGNAKCEQVDYLDASAPSMAKALKEAGYSTAHIGKWHMGGGRDVDDAPQIPLYGFDEYISTYESPDPDKLITASDWIWSKQDSIKRWERTGYFVDKALDFLFRHKNNPCFVNLWPDDMHDPWIPQKEFFDDRKSWTSQSNFIAVLEEYDRQIGRFIDGLKKMGMLENTLIIFTSDNGALPTFDQIRTNGLRGSKVSLYEGGIRMPFIISWPAKIKTGEVEDESVVCSVDIFPSLCAITGAKMPDGFNYSGEDMSKSLLGIKAQQRKKDIVWDFGRNQFFGRPPQPYHQSPHLGIRRGDWKVLVNADGTSLELFNIKEDPNETSNISGKYPQMAEEMSEKVISWYFTKRKVR